MVDTRLKVPKHAHSNTSCGRHHTFVLVLVDPALSLACVHDELVIAESRIYKGVDKGGCEIKPGRVVALCTSGRFEMRFIDVLNTPGFFDADSFTEVAEMSTELDIAKALQNVVTDLRGRALTLNLVSFDGMYPVYRYLSTGKEEGELLLHHAARLSAHSHLWASQLTDFAVHRNTDESRSGH